MIDIRKLKELVRLMVANDLSELDLRDNEEQVTLRRHSPGGAVTMVPQAAAVAMPAAPAPVAPAAAPATPASPAAPADDENLTRIESPMVGTFYAQPNPDSDTFVKVGDHISAETVVCLVEAMKIFNEIKAECSGTIQKVLVNNGDAIEFGEPLFLVKPD